MGPWPLVGTELTLLRTQFTGNQAVGQGGAQGIGGALLADQKASRSGMCQVTMSGNQAETFGTAMHLQGIAGEAVTIEQASILDNLLPEPRPMDRRRAGRVSRRPRLRLYLGHRRE